MAFAIALLFASAIDAKAKEYPDNYESNENIQWRKSETYQHGWYTLNNHSGLEQSVTLYMVVQDAYYISMCPFEFEFDGKLNEDAPRSNYGFEFMIGMPAEYDELAKVELKTEEGSCVAILKQAQFGLYPGFYNFYNGGQNDSVRDNGHHYFVVSLSPELGRIPVGEDGEVPPAYVEVCEGDHVRLYALVGEKSWAKSVESSFIQWAKDYESKMIENAMEMAEMEEIEVSVPEENPDKLLEHAAPEVQIEEPVESKDAVPAFQAEVEKEDTSERGGQLSKLLISLVVVIALFAICLYVRYLVKKH